MTITGTGFSSAQSVRFGSTAAVTFHVVSATTITAEAPPGPAGLVFVTVQTAGGSPHADLEIKVHLQARQNGGETPFLARTGLSKHS